MKHVCFLMLSSKVAGIFFPFGTVVPVKIRTHENEAIITITNIPPGS